MSGGETLYGNLGTGEQVVVAAAAAVFGAVMVMLAAVQIYVTGDRGSAVVAIAHVQQKW